MQRLFIFICAIITTVSLHAQRGKQGTISINSTATIVNEYARLTANTAVGATSIQVNASDLNANNRFSQNLAAGDLLLIIQIQGAQIIGGNVPEFGTVTDYNGAGNYEWAEVKSVPNSTQIELMCGLQNAHLAAGKTQIIRVPRYKQLITNSTAGITSPAWDGVQGGIVAIEIDSAATLNGANCIDVSGKGFRGGTDPTPNDAWWGVQDFSTTSNGNYGAQKGEGIAGWLTEYDALGGRLCRGAAANGGGGGNSHNAGGGGGSNAGNISNYTGFGNPDISTSNFITAWNLESPGFANSSSSGGGKGGYSHCSSGINALTTAPGTSPGNDDDRRNVGGRGGRPLSYSINQAFMGGGGGGGDAGSSVGGNGGNGGGIVFIRSFGAISGNGTLKANGANGTVSGNDGAGGGGGGGAIIIQSSAGIGNTNFQANGGNGGNQDLSFLSVETQGPGGGGGGGYIAVPILPSSASVNGGLNGETDSFNMNEFPPNGATKGGNGIIINNLPLLEILTATSDTICSAGITNLTALNAANYTYSWGNTPDNFSLGNGLSIQPFISQTTSFYLNSCNLNQTIEIVAEIESAPAVDAGQNLSICAGQEAVLNATAEGNYSWEPNASLASIVLLNQSVSPESTSYFYLNASFSSNCFSRDSVLIAVLPALDLELTSNDPNLCAGESIAIQAITNGQVTWDSPYSVIETGINTINLFPLNSGSIYATVTANGFCERTDTLSFNVNALPAVDAGTGIAICAGTSTQLAGTAEGNFSWISSPSLSDVTLLNPLVNPSESTWYFLSSTSAEGCTKIDSVFIEVGGSAPISAGNDTSICAGSSILLNAAGGNSYAWNNGQFLSDSTAANPFATLTETTSFVLTGSIDGSCIARDTVTINVILPVVPVLFGGGIACNDQPATLSISGVQSVQWEPSNGLLNPNALSTSANPSSSTDYIANFIDFNGCSGTTTAINVSPGINAIGGFSWDQISNFEVIFESNAPGSQTTTWLVNDTLLQGDSVVYDFPYEGFWDVTQIVSSDCGSDSISVEIELIKQVGFEDISETPFMLFPNPGADLIGIQSKKHNLSEFTLRVFNAAGQLIYSLETLNAEFQTIDVRHWSPGVYEFVLANTTQTSHVRFVR